MTPASAAARVTAPAAPSAARETRVRPELRVIPPQPFRAPRGPFVIAVGAVLTLGLLGVLLLNTVVTQEAFQVSALQQKSAALADEEQALTQQVAVADSPQHLESRARALGMVPSVNPVFLRLADGKVLGDPVAGSAVRRAAAPAAGAPATGTSHPSATASPSASASAPAHATGTTADPHASSALRTKAAAAVRTKAARTTATTKHRSTTAAAGSGR